MLLKILNLESLLKMLQCKLQLQNLKMFEEKKLDRTEFERRLGELGLRVTDD